ncbi:hypothetical protein MJO28_011794 [Puccinia striiformis f. sp. tritici]|uniref:Uncharacterized protein n=1 Tax=Puccinia striiformis f. sp. tritici TaxID=168172 RepID=A0ACC0E4F3_9BASI|nr:hypothetical protein MJO28_011794 [Puccinia striiformis f. sp. tritici]
MTSPVNEPPTSFSFKTPTLNSSSSTVAESQILTDLQSRLDSPEVPQSLSALSTMSTHERYHLPELTRDNFLDWQGKVISVLRSKGLYDLVLDQEEKRRDEKGQFIAKDKDPSRLERLNHAHAIMYTRINPSLTSRLSQNGGNTCPIALWINIQSFGASKKKANAFKAWVKLNGLNLRIDNISQFSTEYWNCIATLQSLGEVIEPVSLGHALLAKLPAGLSHVRDSLIAAGSSSEVEITYETVLDLLDSQVVPETKSIATPLSQKYTKPDEASALLTQKCPDGRHLPSASHTSEKCFLLHPELLVEYRKHMKAKADAEAHLTMLLGPSMYNVEVSNSTNSPVADLVDSFNKLPGNSAFGSDDGHESEVSLI